MKKLILTGIAALTIGCAPTLKMSNLEKIYFNLLPQGYTIEVDTDRDKQGDLLLIYEVKGRDKYGFTSELVAYCVDKNKDGKYDLKTECVKMGEKHDF